MSKSAFARAASVGITGVNHPERDGMTLLEYYAGQALVGISSKIMNVSKDFSKDLEMQEFAASVSFGLAEAMINESEKRSQ